MESFTVCKIPHVKPWDIRGWGKTGVGENRGGDGIWWQLVSAKGEGVQSGITLHNLFCCLSY